MIPLKGRSRQPRKNRLLRQRRRPGQSSAEPPADYVIPPRSSYKIPKIVRAEDVDKPKPVGPTFTAGEEVDYDPFEEGSTIVEAGKALIGGAVESTASAVGGAGAFRQTSMLERAQEEARAKIIAEEKARGVDMSDLTKLPPAEQARIRKRLQDANDALNKDLLTNIQNDPFYKAGLATKDWSQETFKAAHDFEDSWTKAIFSGLGSTIPHIAVNFIPVAGQAISAGAGFAQSADEALQRAIDAGATPQQLQNALRVGGIPGISEQLPMEVLFERVPLPVAGKFLGVVMKLGAKAFAEGGQEGFQQFAQNMIEKYNYDPKQDLTEGVVEAAGIGAIVGGIAGAPAAVVGEKDDEEAPAKPDDQPDVAAPVVPEGTPATPDAAIGQPSPGGVSASPAPPPAGTDKQPPPAVPAAPVAGTDPRTAAKPPLPPPTVPTAPRQPMVTETRKGDVDPAVRTAIGTPPSAGAGPANVPGGTPPVAALPEAEADIEEEPVAPLEAGDEDLAAAAARDRWAPILAREKAAEQIVVPPVAANDADIKAALATPGKKVTVEPSVPSVPTPVGPGPMPTGAPVVGAGRETLGTGQALQAQPAEPAATLETPPVPPEQPVAAAAAAPTAAALAPEPALLPTAPVPVEAAPAPAALVSEPVPTFQAGEEVDFDPFAGETVAQTFPGKAPKAVAVIRKSRAKATGKPAERVPVKQAPAPQPTLPSQPAAAAPAPRSPIVRDIANDARQTIRHGKSMVDEVEGFDAAVDEVADQVIAANPRPKDQSPGAYMREMSGKIAAAVDERLSPKLAEVEKEKQRIAELATPEGRAKQAEEKRVAKMAAAVTPQKKERAGKGGEKSATGIRAEFEQSTSDAVKRELKKPEAERDANVMRWDALRKERTKAKGAEAKAAITEQMKAVQEERAAAAEKAAEGEVLTPRAVAADKAVREVIPASPNAVTPGHVRSLWESFKGITLSKKLDTKKQTPAENFAIWVRGIIAQTGTRKISDEDQIEAFIAHKLLEAGDNQHLYELITSETIEGLGTKGDAADQIAQMAAEVEEEQELRRGGAAGARARGRAVSARAAKGARGPHPLTVTKPDGTDVSIRVQSTRKASAVLSEVNALAGPVEGFMGMLQSMLTKRLGGLVGDIDVHIVSPETMAKLGHAGASGLHYDYNDAMRAAGYRPMVFINAMEQFDNQLYSHTVLHELTHAATSQAIRDNPALADTVKSMREDLYNQLRSKYSNQELADAGLRHAFRTNQEFIAEAFTNKQLQELLAQIQVPTQLRASVHRLTPNKAPTWWDAFTAAVSKAIGMIRGVRGQTYMEQVIKLDPVLFRSEISQAKRAKEKMVSPTKADAFMPGSIEALDRGIWDQARRYVVPKFRFGAGDAHLRDKWSTTGGIMRDSQQTWGNDLLYDLGREALRKDEIFKERRRFPGEGIDSQQMEEDYAAFESKHQKEAEKLDSFLNTNTIFEIDGTVPINHPNNGHISKQGARSSQQRAEHAKAVKEWAKLTPEAQAMGKRVIDHYKKTHDLEMNAIVREAFNNAQDKYGGTLPPGVTIERAVRWVRGIPEPGQTTAVDMASHKDAERTQFDKDMHAALGKTGETLADVRELTKKKGIYVPLHREGKFFISGEEQVFDPNNLPQGASVEPLPTNSKKHFNNRLVFTNARDAEAFRNSQQGYTHLTFRHVDPKTGKRVPAIFQEADPSVPGGIRTARKEFIVTVQNNLMEMSNNEGELQARREELTKQGMRVSEPRLSGQASRQVAQDISTPQIQRLLKNVGQTTAGATPAGQQILHDAILDLHVRQLTSPGHLQRRLKRRNVKGEVSSTFKALQAYNRSIGNKLAGLEVQQAVSKADKRAQDFIDQDSYNRFGKDSRVTQDRQSQLNEVRDRLRNVKNETTQSGGARILNHVRNYAVLRYLASPHYVIMQGIQFYTGSIPVLAKHGLSGYAAVRELHRALKLGGGWRTTAKRGAQEFGKAATGKKGGDLANEWKVAALQQPDGDELVKVLEEVNAIGFGLSNSIEAPSVAEADMTGPQKLMHRGVNVAMAVPQAIEASNRYAMAIASYRLAKRDGLDHDAALKRAVLSVEEAQGGYGAGNYNSVMRNPLLGAAFQFRKYGIGYAGVYYRALNRSLRGATPAERKSARRQLGYMTVMAGMFAGVFGQAGMEVARTLVNLVALTGAIDDWEEQENEMQEWLAGMIRWASGSEALGDKLSEAALRGPLRLLGIDTANSLSQDNIVTFGQPKTMDEEGTGWWLAKMFIGASGGMAVDTMKGIARADFSSPGQALDTVVGALPLPKILELGLRRH